MATASFEERAGKANRLCSWLTIAGIPLSIWLGMLLFKANSDLPTSVFYAGLLQYLFVSVAYVVSRTRGILWQIVKQALPFGAMLVVWIAAFRELEGESLLWVALPLAIVAGFGCSKLVSDVAYAAKKHLRFDDKIHRLTIWSGSGTISNTRDKVNTLLKERSKALLPEYHRLQSEADKRVAEGAGSDVKRAKALYLRLISELETEPPLSGEGQAILGKAFLGLGKAHLALGESVKAIEAFAKARSYGFWTSRSTPPSPASMRRPKPRQMRRLTRTSHISSSTAMRLPILLEILF